MVNKNKNNLSLLRKTGAAIASLLFTGGLIAAGSAGVRAQLGEDLTDLESTSVGVISLEEVAEEADRLSGYTVTISGEVEKIISPNAFILQETGSLYNDDRVLVILASPPQIPIVEEREVQVTGEVRQFISADFERDYDLTWDLDFKRTLEAEYTGAATVVANFTSAVVR